MTRTYPAITSTSTKTHNTPVLLGSPYSEVLNYRTRTASPCYLLRSGRNATKPEHLLYGHCAAPSGLVYWLSVEIGVTIC